MATKITLTRWHCRIAELIKHQLSQFPFGTPFHPAVKTCTLSMPRNSRLHPYSISATLLVTFYYLLTIIWMLPNSRRKYSAHVFDV